MNNIDLMTDSPVVIDTWLLQLMSVQHRAFCDGEVWYSDMVHQVADTLKYTWEKGNRYHPVTGIQLSRSDVYAHAKQSTNEYLIKAYQRNREASARWNEATDNIIKIDTAYVTRRWSRYWLVVSSSGHIHRSMECSTCNNGLNPTGFVLKPSLSGSSDDEAVAALGAALCSHCFPDAPVHHREQVRISKSLTALLLNTGDEAQFDAALLAAKAKTSTLCAGSSQPGVAANNGRYLNCTHCENVIAAWRMDGATVTKMSRHKPFWNRK